MYKLKIQDLATNYEISIKFQKYYLLNLNYTEIAEHANMYVNSMHRIRLENLK